MIHDSLLPVPAIILAAGASRRLGQPKQLVVNSGETLLARAIRVAQKAGAAPVVVVLGSDSEAISASLGKRRDLVIVENPDWAEGIASSIRSGLQAAERHAPMSGGVLLSACDQPHVSSEHLQQLLARFHAQFDSAIVASLYGGTRGIPAVFPRSMFPLLEALAGDTGARSLLAHPPCPLAGIALRGGEIDIDTPADLDQLDRDSQS